MAKYQQYAEYKESGVERLGQIPIDWIIFRLKNVLKIRNGRDYKEVEVESGGYPVYGSGGIFKRSSSYLYDGKSILFGRKGTIDKPLLISGKFWTVDTMFYSEIYDNAMPEYIYYQSLSFPFNFLTTNTALPSMTQEDLLELIFVLPSLSEQLKITNFLDHETAQIDTLIEKQQTLIQLLKEKRQAVISHAVTKGLNPNAPMKDSGVEWLGSVPKHWVVQSIKYAFESLNFRRIPLSSEIRGERKGSFRYYGASGVIDYVDDYIFDEPTVLVGEDGANLVSRNTPLAYSAHGKYWVNNHAHILRPKDAFADYWAEVIEHIDVNPIVSGSAQPKLTAEALSNLIIAFPPATGERAQIDTYIKKRKEKYGDLIQQATIAIELMQERRTALISAAVTGKIDVRGWRAAE